MLCGTCCPRRGFWISGFAFLAPGFLAGFRVSLFGEPGFVTSGQPGFTGTVDSPRGRALWYIMLLLLLLVHVLLHAHRVHAPASLSVAPLTVVWAGSDAVAF